ncbi:MAG: hypothetical protein GYB67_01500, partial [Chloroflexi bacterium]|nr:hypothetical protein [Chloroflexota bacterium]
VAVRTLERYNLPRTDRGAHDRFMEQYPPDTDTLNLWDVAVEGMMQYSSNAASDYLLDRLAPINWEPLYQRLSITETDYPHSLTLIPLLMNNHQDRLANLDDVAEMSSAQGERYLDLYIDNAVWREEEIAYRERRGRTFPDWDVQAAILETHTAHGTVSDFLTLLNAIYGAGGPLSPRLQAMVRDALRWDDNAFLDAHYVEFGSKLGSYSGGTLTLVAYGEPINGRPVISATFLRNIPRETYFAMLSDDSIGNFAHWMNFNACVGINSLFGIG